MPINKSHSFIPKACPDNPVITKSKHREYSKNSGITKSKQDIKRYKESYLIDKYLESNYKNLFKFSDFNIVNKFVCRLCLENRIIYQDNFQEIFKNYIKCFEDYNEKHQEHDITQYDVNKLFSDTKNLDCNAEELFLIDLFYKEQQNFSISDNKILEIKSNVCEYSDTVDLSNKQSITISWNSIRKSYKDKEVTLTNALEYFYRLGFRGKVYIKYLNTDFFSDWNMTSNYEVFYDDCDINKFFLYVMQNFDFDALGKKIDMFRFILLNPRILRSKSTTEEKIKELLSKHYFSDKDIPSIENFSFNDYFLVFSKLFKNPALEFLLERFGNPDLL